MKKLRFNETFILLVIKKLKNLEAIKEELDHAGIQYEWDYWPKNNDKVEFRIEIHSFKQVPKIVKALLTKVTEKS